jgi:hypothetical protein
MNRELDRDQIVANDRRRQQHEPASARPRYKKEFTTERAPDASSRQEPRAEQAVSAVESKQTESSARTPVPPAPAAQRVVKRGNSSSRPEEQARTKRHDSETSSVAAKSTDEANTMNFSTVKPPSTSEQQTQPNHKSPPLQTQPPRVPEIPSLADKFRRHIDPYIVWAYDCGSCSARNVVRRETRFLETYVEVPEAYRTRNEQPAPTATTATTAVAATDNRPRNFSTTIDNNYNTILDGEDDAARELNDILNCRDEIDTHFLVALPPTDDKAKTQK